MAQNRKRKQETDELRKLSDSDLMKDLEDTYRQLFTARLQVTTRQLANTSLPRRMRHRVARIKTIQRERQIAAHQAAAQAGG
jgi:large subunit ribosomal protein L29